MLVGVAVELFHPQILQGSSLWNSSVRQTDGNSGFVTSYSLKSPI